MIVQEFLKSSVAKLKRAGIGTARLDCLVLLEDATGHDRAWLLAHPEYKLNVKGRTFHKLVKQVTQRQKHIPLAQIRGKTEFYGREFIINKYVLEPRPESETMIELLCRLDPFDFAQSKLRGEISRQAKDDLIIVDVGTGSGALAITAKLEIPKAEVIATDIDPHCLKIARQNASKHNANIKFYRSNLLNFLDSKKYKTMFNLDYRSNKVKSRQYVVLSNLPYVPDSYEINQAALHEPKIAIFGGPDGLDLYRQMFEQISKLDQKPAFVLTESLPFQHKGLATIAKKVRYKQIKEEDFIQVFISN